MPLRGVELRQRHRALRQRTGRRTFLVGTPSLGSCNFKKGLVHIKPPTRSNIIGDEQAQDSSERTNR